MHPNSSLLLLILNWFLSLNCSASYIRVPPKRRIRFPDEIYPNNGYEENCVAFNKNKGSCIMLADCPYLRQKNNVRLLRLSHCGFKGDNPMVCCPLYSSTTTKTTTTTTSSSTASITATSLKPSLPYQRNPFHTSSSSFTSEATPFEGSTNPYSTVSVRVPEKPVFHPHHGHQRETVSPTESDSWRRKFPKNCGEPKGPLSRVVGGQPADPGAWPWMAALLVEDNGLKTAQCGATLVSWNLAITAAHCVVDGTKLKDVSSLTVRLGEHHITQESPDDAIEDVPVKKVVAHEDFDQKTYLNDIAILTLDRKVNFTQRIAPVCLPFESEYLKNGDLVGLPVTLTGWGRTAFNGPSSEVLRQASFEIIDQEKCKSAFQRFVQIKRVYICAGNEISSKDSCQGDSGGPLIAIDKGKWTLVGIVSFGRRCATPGFPGVYTRVTSFVDWIQRHI